MTVKFDQSVFYKVWDIIGGPSTSDLCDCLRLGERGVDFELALLGIFSPVVIGITMAPDGAEMVVRTKDSGVQYGISYSGQTRRGKVGQYPSDYKLEEEEPGNITVLRMPSREDLFDGLRLRRLQEIIVFDPTKKNGHPTKLLIFGIDRLHLDFEGSWLVRGKLQRENQSVVIHSFTNFNAGVMKEV